MTVQVTQRAIDKMSEEQIALVKRTICKGADNDELQLFIHACNKTGLDPFMKQIYAIKRGAVMTIQTGIDGFRLIAERTGNYSPGREPTFAYDEKGHLLSATAYIKKKTSDGVWHEIAATAHLEEYNAGQGLWKKMPKAMLAKCSEALCLRKSFPADLSGLYTQEEMQQADVEIVSTQPTGKQSLQVEAATPPKARENGLIGQEEASKIDKALEEAFALPNQREEFRKNILKSCKVNSFEEVPASMLKALWNSINVNKKKVAPVEAIEEEVPL